MNIYNTRLLNVAKALRESPNPDMFDMEKYGHSCGTPACALGHYAAREDLQDFLSLDEEGIVYYRADEGNENAYGVDYQDEDVAEHFGLDPDSLDAHAIFSTRGCGNAGSATEAAEFIETFVRMRLTYLE